MFVQTMLNHVDITLALVLWTKKRSFPHYSRIESYQLYHVEALSGRIYRRFSYNFISFEPNVCLRISNNKKSEVYNKKETKFKKIETKFKKIKQDNDKIK